MAVVPLVVADVTTSSNENSTVVGTGVLDVLMNAVRANVYEEYEQGRITGQEYAEVYLGATQSSMQMGLEFLFKKDLIPLEAENLRLTGLRLEKEGEKIDAEILLTNAQIARMQQEVALITAQVSKMGKEEDLIDQQILDMIQKVALTTAQVSKMTKEESLIDGQIAQLLKDGALSDAQVIKLTKDGVLVDKKVLDTEQDTLNKVTEETVLVAQECKLRAEFDVLIEQKNKVASEAALLNQKRLTEAAQVNTALVDQDSVIGRQKDLYLAQTDGFARDAEQKAAKLMIDTWNVRRTTDDTADPFIAGVGDLAVKSAADKLLAGIGV